jgi:hypothetical protein
MALVWTGWRCSLDSSPDRGFGLLPDNPDTGAAAWLTLDGEVGVDGLGSLADDAQSQTMWGDGGGIKTTTVVAN